MVVPPLLITGQNTNPYGSTKFADCRIIETSIKLLTVIEVNFTLNACVPMDGAVNIPEVPLYAPTSLVTT